MSRHEGSYFTPRKLMIAGATALTVGTTMTGYGCYSYIDAAARDQKTANQIAEQIKTKYHAPAPEEIARANDRRKYPISDEERRSLDAISDRDNRIKEEIREAWLATDNTTGPSGLGVFTGFVIGILGVTSLYNGIGKYRGQKSWEKYLRRFESDSEKREPYKSSSAITMPGTAVTIRDAVVLDHSPEDTPDQAKLPVPYKPYQTIPLNIPGGIRWQQKKW